MKKLYLLLLLCLLNNATQAQTTVTLFANGASGSYTCGYASSTGFRYDGGTTEISGAGTSYRNYAVFNLASAGIPAGATIMSATLVEYAYISGPSAVCSTNVYVGDLSTVTVGSTLFSDMAAPPSTNVSNAAIPAGTGDKTFSFNATGLNLIGANLSSKVSVALVYTAASSFYFYGEIYSTTTTGAHAPYLQITYCPKPTGVTASASPATVCLGDNVTLTATGTSTSGTLTFSWNGPAGYTGVGSPATSVAASTGVYSLTAINTCGTSTATASDNTSAMVTVNPVPSPITGPGNVCTGSAINLTDPSGGGTWSSSTTSAATVDAAGFVYGVGAGVTTITYKNISTGCYVTSNVTDNDPPTAIAGPGSVCEGSTITLTDGVPGGAWSSSATGVASIDPSSGILTGEGTSGTAYINYTVSGCPPASMTVTVNPVPSAISGTTTVCAGDYTTLTDVDGGGTWLSSNPAIVLIGSASGLAFGAASGGATVTYTLGSGCYNTTPVTINPVPSAFTGPASVCASGSTITLSDATGGGVWSSSDNSIATITTPGGMVTGVGSGAANITYMVGGCYYTSPITVYPLPPAISGAFTICQGTSSTLSDASAGGGTWVSSTTTAAVIGSSSGVVSGVAAGASTITFTAITGCITTFPITVNPAPPTTITAGGPTTFCAGGSVTLTAPAGGGYSYQWSDNGTPITGATTSSIAVTTSGSITVTVTNGLSCSATSAPTIVSAGLDPLITHASSDSFCAGSNVILGINLGGAIGAATYQWMLNGVDIPSATAGNYLATLPGIYTASVTVSGGSGTCSAVTPGATVAVFPIPSPTISYNGHAFFTGNTYSTYQWFVNAVSIPGANSYMYVPTANGSYRVLVGDVNSCTGYSANYDISNLGVKQVGSGDITLYPNPVKNTLHISAPGPVRAVVTGLEGKVLIDRTNAEEVDMSRLSAGMYIIVLYDENGERVMVQKTIKE